jgi:3-dehydroquinate dehydratase / shikimate dehydrogenase
MSHCIFSHGERNCNQKLARPSLRWGHIEKGEEPVLQARRDDPALSNKSGQASRMSTTQGPVACAVIARTRHKMMQMEIQEAVKQGARLVELRLDYLSKPPDFKRLLASRPCPMIATVRRPEDGGRWARTEDERQVLLRQAIAAGFDYVDLEVDIADKIPRFGKVQRIVSYHNLRELPDDLEAIFKTMATKDPDLLKVAVTAQQPADNLRVLALLREPPKPTVALCMGDLGTPSRILGLCRGMPFTYGAFNKERSIAPGILSFQELQKLYHVERLNAETQIFGVIGDPVGHSLSPLIHNKALRRLGVNAVYVPFRVPRGELAPFLESFRQLPVQGYSVTIPHKEAAAKLALMKDEAVETMGSANTLLAGEHSFRAFSTDAEAALDSLRAHLPLGEDGRPVSLASRSVLVLGAGGVARAIAFALAREGAVLNITNRTEARGIKLAEEVGCKFVDWAARHNILCDTLINCTSVGMHPNLDESPIHNSFLKPGILVFDTIYTPETTLLVREARSRGCLVLTGVDMFVRQAALQFKIFTGKEAALDMMTRTVRRALSPVQGGGEDDSGTSEEPASSEPLP